MVEPRDTVEIVSVVASTATGEEQNLKQATLESMSSELRDRNAFAASLISRVVIITGTKSRSLRRAKARIDQWCVHLYFPLSTEAEKS